MDDNQVIPPGKKGPKETLTDEELSSFVYDFCKQNADRTSLAREFGRGLSRTAVYRAVVRFLKREPTYLADEAKRRGEELDPCLLQDALPFGEGSGRVSA